MVQSRLGRVVGCCRVSSVGRTGVDSSQGSGVALESKAGDLHLTAKKATPNLCWHRVLKSNMKSHP